MRTSAPSSLPLLTVAWTVLAASVASATIDNGSIRSHASVPETHRPLCFIRRGGGFRNRTAEVPIEPVEPPSFYDRVGPAVDRLIESSFYSKDRSPKSYGDAEWNGFLNGWMLVVLPIPLPILIAALVGNTAILMASKWDNVIKNKYLIGFFHGVMSMGVLLRELEIQQNGADRTNGFSSRIAMMGLNLATSLFLGQAGDFPVTKHIMDAAIFATLLYVLIHYFSK